MLDRDNNPLAIDPLTLEGALLAAETSGPNRVVEAQWVMMKYFSYLASPFNSLEDYQDAADHYGGSYEDLTRLYPDIDPLDKAALLQRACIEEEFYCLRVRQVLSGEVVRDNGAPTNFYRYEVEFLNRDGTLFSLNGQTVFTYEVEYNPDLNPEVKYYIHGLPPR